MLLQEFQPMAVQLSMKAALPLAKILVTASRHSSKTKLCGSTNGLFPYSVFIILTIDFLLLIRPPGQTSVKCKSKRKKNLFHGNCIKNVAKKMMVILFGLQCVNSLKQVTHTCISKLSHHWFRYWLVACLAPTHYLNQC